LLRPDDLQEVQESEIATRAVDSDELRAILLAAKPERRSTRIERGLLVAAIIVLLGGAAAFAMRRGGDDAVAAEPPPSQVAPAVATPAAPDAVASLILRAQQMMNRGDRDDALALVLAGRATYPNDARLPRFAGMIYFDKLWWADGVKQLRAALAIDPALRDDPELTAVAVTGFITTPTYNRLLGRFLRDELGAAAMPNLERVAREHRNPAIRARADAELRRMAAH
jgi:Flp pilus assembly pilin Flp